MYCEERVAVCKERFARLFCIKRGNNMVATGANWQRLSFNCVQWTPAFPRKSIIKCLCSLYNWKRAKIWRGDGVLDEYESTLQTWELFCSQEQLFGGIGGRRAEGGGQGG